MRRVRSLALAACTAWAAAFALISVARAEPGRAVAYAVLAGAGLASLAIGTALRRQPAHEAAPPVSMFMPFTVGLGVVAPALAYWLDILDERRARRRVRAGAAR